MARYMTLANSQLTLNSHVLNNAILIQITRRENGLAMATIDYVDTQAADWITNFDVGDSVLSEIKDVSDGSYTTLFRGRLAPVVNPVLPPSMMHLKCEGNGWPLAYMIVANEYGSQVSASYDEIDEIADDIIDNYVEKVFADAASGFTVNTEIDAATLTSTMRYMSFPYVPAYKSIDQMLEIYQGVRGANAGAHWIVDNSATPKLYIQEIGAHSAQAKTDGWTNYLLGNDATNATFVEGVDFLNFNFSKAVKEANYVLYYGAWKHPCPDDEWAENNSGDWDFEDVGGGGNPGEINDDAADYVMGSKSIEIITEDVAGQEPGIRAWYPDTFDLNLDIEKVGGKLNKPSFMFWAKPDAYVAGIPTTSLPGISVVPFVFFATGDPSNGDWYVYPFGNQLNVGAWNKVKVPIGPYSGCTVFGGGSPDWADIDAFGFYFFSTTGGQEATMNIDGPHFTGYVARVAKQAAAYSSGDPCIMKRVTDDYAKDDVIADNDKTGTISKLAYAEYLRASSTPITGTFTTPLVKDLWPGQKIHVHAKKQSGGSFRIDSDFRVTEFTHIIGINGYHTRWTVTDDVTNTHTQPLFNSINKNLAAVRPGTQDMQATSMNMREIDITQDRLVNTY